MRSLPPSFGAAHLVGGAGGGRPRPPAGGSFGEPADTWPGPSRDVIGCPDCGLIQNLPKPPRRGSLRCLRCDSALERTNGRSLDAALACSLATLLLLFPANLLPILQVNILAATNRSVIASGAIGIWHQDWPLTALVVGLEIVVIPFVRFGTLTAVLLALRLGKRGGWLGPVFRWSERLDQWAMVDVFLFGGVVGYTRVAPFLPIRIEPGGWCLIAAAFLTLVTRASLERRQLWRRIGPVVRERHQEMIGCSACDFPVTSDRAGSRCPRCRARIWPCRPNATMRAVALTVAAFAFYPAAYLFPMEYSAQFGTRFGYSIMTGVNELFQVHLWFFGVVIFCASIVVPLLKLFAMTWFGISIHRRSNSRLRLKTNLYRVVNAIGRWSHIDVFTVSVFLPLMQLRGVLGVVVGRALPAFLAVVVFTMFASELFDPRALWLAGRRRP
ncbi:MAG: paraquat-inducible protein A [Opitutaceae bacterium]